MDTKQHSNGKWEAPFAEAPMALWNSVCNTDPQHTKDADNGKYKFTSVDPQFQLKMATELWGPYGAAWKLEDLQFQIIATVNGKGDAQSLVGHGVFKYPGGEFEVWADMPYRWNDDAYKKLLTALRSKALSSLGFNADVYLGQYEDDRYVGEMRAKFADEHQMRATMLKNIRTAPNEERLAQCRAKLEELRGNNAINKALYDEGLEAIEQQTLELAG